MYQAKFSIDESHLDFIRKFKGYGFKDKSSLVRAALDRFREALELESLKQSADLYAEIYERDTELKELTESALSGWPE